MLHLKLGRYETVFDLCAFLSLMWFQPAEGDDASSTFTETELLIGFQKTDHAIIYRYYLKNLASYMTKTLANVVPTFVPLSPTVTYRVDFLVESLQFYL